MEDIIKNDKSTIEIDNHKYFYKPNDAYVEILIEKIADLFNLNHASYYTININNFPYYFSEDLNNKGKFITAYEAGLESSRLEDIIDFVIKSFPNNCEKLINDITKMFFMDLLILNIDRSNNNWGFLINDDNVDMYILDNDLSFIYNNSVFTTLDNNVGADSLLEIKNVFDTFSKDDVKLFDEMFNALDNDKLKELIKETEKDIKQELPFKANYLKRYDLHRWRIRRIRGKNKVLIRK